MRPFRSTIPRTWGGVNNANLLSMSAIVGEVRQPRLTLSCQSRSQLAERIVTASVYAAAPTTTCLERLLLAKCGRNTFGQVLNQGAEVQVQRSTPYRRLSLDFPNWNSISSLGTID
jgi:hypothetical protein